MCILCVIQKWSRRVATMLPWLVIPLIGLWALSQLQPPALRFEITSPKLVCVFVLLATLFWYEILMPHLSAWGVRRNAQLRERKRTEVIELQKLRKTATRKCRNCLNPYRDQTPGGGRFMCSYCGHISKRPVLDLPVPPGLEVSYSGLVKDLVGRSGKMLNGKAWSENGWICSQEWLGNNNWVSGPVAGRSSHWRKNGAGLIGGDDGCLAEKSYSGLVIFACRLLTCFFMSIRWLLRKIFRISSSKEASSSDADHRTMLAQMGENGVNFLESRGEKARRKAEEKRQTRLEKELEEEEERKQREEVARLVEERRKLRDEVLEAERDRSKSSPPAREKESKKKAERKRQERRKEKDRGSSKSNSDTEEFDKKAGKESEWKRDSEKKYETEHRDHHKPGLESLKGQNFEQGHVIKNTSSSNFGHGDTGNRYLDRMRGTFLSSSRAFGGTGFFRRPASTPPVAKENKFTNSVEHAHNSSFRRDICPPERVSGKLKSHGDDKNVNRPVILDHQPMAAPKKSWQQLFTRANATTTPANSNVISRQNPKMQVDGNSPLPPGQPSAMQSSNNPINFGLPSPFTLSSYPSIPTSGGLCFSPPVEPIFHRVVDRPCEIVPEESELFEDPCYIPDPISLLGPVSESLDNFQLDLGMDRPHTLQNVSVSPKVNKPSPIESPLTRIRATVENHNSSSWISTTPKAQDMHTFVGEGTNVNQTGTWQMWNSSPLGQDCLGLGLVGVSGSWLLTQEWNKPTKENPLQPSSPKPMASFFSKDDQVLSGTQSPQKSLVGNGLNSGMFSPSAGSSLSEPWLQKTAFPPLSGSDGHFSLSAQDESSQNEMIYGSPTRAAADHSFESSPVHRWSKKELAVQGSEQGFANFAVTKPHAGSLSPAPDVHSLWSFN